MNTHSCVACVSAWVSLTLTGPCAACMRQLSRQLRADNAPRSAGCGSPAEMGAHTPYVGVNQHALSALVVLLCSLALAAAQGNSTNIGTAPTRRCAAHQRQPLQPAPSPRPHCPAEFCGHDGANDCRPVNPGEFFAAVGALEAFRFTHNSASRATTCTSRATGFCACPPDAGLITLLPYLACCGLVTFAFYVSAPSARWPRLLGCTGSTLTHPTARE